jgi:hypothetical protein
MLYRNITFLRFAVIAALASMAYSGNSSVTLADQPVPGSYELSFFTEDFSSSPPVLVPVSSLPACTPSPGVSCPDLVLKAHITDSAGLPAQGGSVTLQICVIAGNDFGDLHRHWAPSAECDNGPGEFNNYGASFQLNESGDAFIFFGIITNPRTIGFRFRYSGHGSGIANGMSGPKDFTWTPAQ